MSMGQGQQQSSAPATGLQNNQLITGTVAALISGALLSAGAAAATIWRGEPLTTATLSRIEQRVDKLESAQQISSNAQTRSEGQIQANKQKIDQLESALTDIKTYQYRTSERMSEVSTKMSRIEGYITREKEGAR